MGQKAVMTGQLVGEQVKVVVEQVQVGEGLFQSLTAFRVRSAADYLPLFGRAREVG